MRPIACRPTWSRKGPKIGRSGLGQLVDRDDCRLSGGRPARHEPGGTAAPVASRTSAARAFGSASLVVRVPSPLRSRLAWSRPDGVDPRRLERPALGRDPQAEKDRVGSPQGRSGGARHHSRSRPAPGPVRARGGQGEEHECRCADHPRSSLMGLAFGSTSRIGRPLSTVFCLAGSIPRPLMTVASRSGTSTGRSLTCSPSAPVSPIAWPP